MRASQTLHKDNREIQSILASSNQEYKLALDRLLANSAAKRKYKQSYVHTHKSLEEFYESIMSAECRDYDQFINLMEGYRAWINNESDSEVLYPDLWAGLLGEKIKNHPLSLERMKLKSLEELLLRNIPMTSCCGIGMYKLWINHTIVNGQHHFDASKFHHFNCHYQYKVNGEFIESDIYEWIPQHTGRHTLDVEYYDFDHFLGKKYTFGIDLIVSG